MPKPPKLTDRQKERLRILEPALRNAVKLGQYENAKRITARIQELLRPTGHETRLMKSKNWVFEAAMEAGKLHTAERGFIGVRGKMNKRTRTFLEATALLAVCYIRMEKMDKAKPLMAEVLQNQKVIRSDKKRKDFKRNVIERFEQECALTALKNTGNESLIVDEIQTEAGKLLSRFTSDDDIYQLIGRSVPDSVSQQILQVERFAQKQLPAHEFKYLPDPRDKIKDEEVGKTIFNSFKRIAWRSLCDPESDIYKSWFNDGIKLFLNKKYLTVALITSFSNMGIAIKAVAISVVALVMKFGIEVYCDRYQPEGIMEARR